MKIINSLGTTNIKILNTSIINVKGNNLQGSTKFFPSGNLINNIMVSKNGSIQGTINNANSSNYLLTILNAQGTINLTVY